MPNIFKDGGGAGIGSYVVVFEDGQLAANTDLLRLRGAYESGEQIYFSVDDAETEDALVPASGWIGKEDGKLHLVARDFDDNKTYEIALDQGLTESEIHVEVEVKDGIEMGEGEVPTQGDIEEAKATLAGTSLVIPEQEGPKPVIEIDGVKYYHKQEFDVEALAVPAEYDLLTGENKGLIGYVPSIVSTQIPGGGPKSHRLTLSDSYSYSLDDSSYTSRAFTVVDTQEEVTDNSKICLPTCSAYYGYLSEDGKTFISYYNLKSDGAPEYIDSVKQGNAVIPLAASKILSGAETAGKVLTSDGDGGVVWNTPSVGSQLYRHVIRVQSSGPGRDFILIDGNSTPYTSVDDIYNLLSPITESYYMGADNFGIVLNSIGYDYGSMSVKFYETKVGTANSYNSYTITGVTDTVTAL